MAKKRDHVERFHTREGVAVSYTVWTDGQGAELMFEAPMQPTRSLSLSLIDIGAFEDMLQGMLVAISRQLIAAQRVELDALRAAGE